MNHLFKNKLEEIIKETGIEYCIFDFAGTVFNLPTDYDQMKKELADYSETLSSRKAFSPIWKTINCLLEDMPAERSLEIRQEFLEIIKKHELDSVAWGEMLPGAKEALCFLAEQGIPFAILSNNTEEAIEKLWENNELPKYDQLVGINQVKNPKPDPAGFNMIMARCGVDKKKILFVGDTRYDIDLANQMGVKSMLIINHINESYDNFNELKEQAGWQIDLR